MTDHERLMPPKSFGSGSNQFAVEEGALGHPLLLINKICYQEQTLLAILLRAPHSGTRLTHSESNTDRFHAGSTI